MPAVTPRRAGRQPQPGSVFLSDVVADKARAYRLLRRLEQADVAEGMVRLGHPWTQATVSQVERGQRNVTIDELMGLSMLFGIPLAKLTDPTPLDGSDPPALDVGLPVPIPPRIVRQWANGAVSIFMESEAGPDGTPRLRFTAVGSLAAEEEGSQ